MKSIIIISVFFLFSNLVIAQENPKPDTTDISELSIEELAKAKSRYNATAMEKAANQSVAAASRKPLSLKKSPSIVSVVTAEEIEKSGARDIMDVLKLVPGIEFNVDVQGSVGISIRGIWANEGKVLLQLDGQEMNEIAYATLQFGNNYNISQIQKVEVIRGPGSAIYGGYAEYAVINIITKSGEELNGISANVLIGQTSDTYARQNVSLSVGQKVKDFNYSVSAFLGKGQRSNQKYTDLSNINDSTHSAYRTYSMINNSNLNPTNINLGLSYKNLSGRFIYDVLNTTGRDGYGYNYSKPYELNFKNYLAELKYVAVVNKKLQIQTKLNYKQAFPWYTNQVAENANDSAGYAAYTIKTERYRGNIAAIWDPTSYFNLTAGGEVFYDNATKPTTQLFRNDSVFKVNYLNYAPYVQALIKSRFANITVGARYDVNSAFGSEFNPRLGITKKVGDFNFKLLYASSYRAPAIENIQTSFGNKIKPEQTQTFEFETGLQLTKDMYLTLSLYDISTQNLILYYVSADTTLSGNLDGYKNVGKSGSQGIDFDYKYKSSFGFLNFNYSYYSVGNKSIDSANIVSLNRSSSLGIANHKFNILASINLGKYVYISPSVNFLGARYGYTSLDTLGAGVLTKYDPNTQVNIYIGTQNIVKGLHFGIGVYNLLDEKILYLQAYNSLHGNYPGIGREFTAKLTYNFNFKTKQ